MPAGAPTRNDPTNISQLLGWGRQLENEHGPDTAKAILSEYYSQRDGLSKDVGRGLAADTLNGNVDTLETVLKDNGAGLAEEEYGEHEDLEVDCECAQGAGECECEVEHSGGDEDENAGMLKSLSFVAKADNGDFVIYGPASVDIVDKEDDVVSKDALESALPNILKRGNLSLEHTDIQPGEIVEKYETDDGKTYKTEVREVTKDDLDTFPKLKDSGAEPGDHALFLTAKLYDDTSFSKEAREKIKNGELGAFSISGQATDEATEKNCGDFTCKLVNVIKDLDGSAVTLAEEGMNSGASFEIVNKAESPDEVDEERDDVADPDHDLEPEGGGQPDDEDEAVEKEEDLDDSDVVPEDEDEMSKQGWEYNGQTQSGSHRWVRPSSEGAEYRYTETRNPPGSGEEPEGGAIPEPPEDFEQNASKSEKSEALRTAKRRIDKILGTGDERTDLEKRLDKLAKETPPNADHGKKEERGLSIGTPAFPRGSRTHGDISEDAAQSSDEGYNELADYPQNSDRLADAPGRTPSVDAEETGRQAGWFQRAEELNSQIEQLAKDLRKQWREAGPHEKQTDQTVAINDQTGERKYGQEAEQALQSESDGADAPEGGGEQGAELDIQSAEDFDREHLLGAYSAATDAGMNSDDAQQYVGRLAEIMPNLAEEHGGMERVPYAEAEEYANMVAEREFDTQLSEDDAIAVTEPYFEAGRDKRASSMKMAKLDIMLKDAGGEVEDDDLPDQSGMRVPGYQDELHTVADHYDMDPTDVHELLHDLGEPEHDTDEEMLGKDEGDVRDDVAHLADIYDLTPGGLMEVLAEAAEDNDEPEEPMEDEETVMKPAPEGVDEDKYDRCVEQVKEEDTAENAHAVCAEQLGKTEHPSGHVQDVELHKLAMAEDGFVNIYTYKCPTCAEIQNKEYEDASSYFKSVQRGLQTGQLPIAGPHPNDRHRLRNEYDYFRQELLMAE